MTLKQIQDLMKQLYYARDKKRGAEKTFIWLVEEIGELGRSFNKPINKNEIEAEFADILAWLSSLANLLDVDLERAVTQKYPNKCPRCEKNPCNCD